MDEINIAILGTKFMGKAHSSAWLNAPRFFDVPLHPVLKVACGQDGDALAAFAARWGWQAVETDWRKVIARDDVNIVDIALPTHLHHEVAVAAAKAGKHIFCEKPLALNLAQAESMYEAAKSAGIVHYLNHNYRRVPAVMLAKQLIDEGKIGRIFHWRGCYLQSWVVDPNFPLTWHLRKETAGSGPHGDLNSHSIDLARFLVGEISTVMAMTTNFVKERPLPGKGAATFSAGSGETTSRGEVTVEDAAFLVVKFANGALGSFEATRFATGRKNYNAFEIYGSKGSLLFNLERMNELQYFSADDPAYAQGFRDILATERGHAYMEGWWPPGHIIGYEHEFTHAVVDFLKAVASGTEIRPNFEDGVVATKVLEAALHSAATGTRITVD
ncbi:MAG TPA: Gfo/Idh/MocA family oxidoreductase [Aggregatilineales bacterium]|nr:Gfo/Idh/MocA family oxidoreductase [Anaerolineales bacterium]HRE46381.1 Gfo/Idh/MocA family oxidoreductase [Aggregatilineales bacterium]